jgi:hypothetical protein
VKKLYDIVAKVGEYQGKDGEMKAKWQSVGAVLEGDKGPFMLLEKWFNPAGVPDAKGGSAIMLSLFSPKERDGGDGEYQASKKPPMNNPYQAAAPGKPGKADNGDGIPF